MFTWWPSGLPGPLDSALILVGGYLVLRFLRGSRAAPLALGVGSLALVCWLLLHFGLSSSEGIVRGVLGYVPIMIIVLFQPEIRQAFISFGDRMRLKQLERRRRMLGEGVYDEIVLAATTLASTKTGMLLVIERVVSLRSIVDGGVRLNAELTYDLLVTIFNPSTPLHDGAVVVQGTRVAAAACFFPLSLNPRISRDLGTRHRAAIGITEDTDAVSVVVSEETGIISFVQAGQITRGLDGKRLLNAIQNAFAPARPRGEEIEPTQDEA
jgi:diadenylate cyclase